MQKTEVILMRAGEEQDTITGRRRKTLAGGSVLVADYDFVGAQTRWAAQAVGQRLKYSVTIPRRSYADEDFLYMLGRLYRVADIGRAKNPEDLTLNVAPITDDELLAEVEKWRFQK